MYRVLFLMGLFALVACKQQQPQSYDDCVQQSTKPGMEGHEIRALKIDCATKFPRPASADSAPAGPRPTPFDQFDVQPPSAQPAPPPVTLPSPASPP